MLKNRLITAAVLIPLVVLGVLYLNQTWFAIITGLLMMLAGFEWAQLSWPKLPMTWYGYPVLLGLIFLGLHLADFPHIILLLSVIWWCFAAYLVVHFPKSSGSTLFLAIEGSAVSGIMVLAPCWLALNAIRADEDGAGLVLLLIGLMVVADSAAYFSGKAWGKTKLVPQLSPGKSWQGLFGAATAVLLFGLIIGFVFSFQMVEMVVFIFTLFIAFAFSLVGDLFESSVKRRAGVKDSGTILPGHGGILDRIDSITAAAPIFALCAIYFGVRL